MLAISCSSESWDNLTHQKPAVPEGHRKGKQGNEEDFPEGFLHISRFLKNWFHIWNLQSPRSPEENRKGIRKGKVKKSLLAAKGPETLILKLGRAQGVLTTFLWKKL